MLAPEWGLRAADRHLRRAGARRPRARVGDGAVVRGAVGPRRGQPPVPQREIDQAQLDPRALPDPLARRGRPRHVKGDRRLLDLGRRARHERLDLHRPRGRLDRRRRRRRAVRRRRRALGPAARRRALARAEDARRGRGARRRRPLGQGRAGPRRAPDGLRPPRLSRRGPARAGAAPHGHEIGSPRFEVAEALGEGRRWPSCRRASPTACWPPTSSSGRP